MICTHLPERAHGGTFRTNGQLMSLKTRLSNTTTLSSKGLCLKSDAQRNAMRMSGRRGSVCIYRTWLLSGFPRLCAWSALT